MAARRPESGGDRRRRQLGPTRWWWPADRAGRGGHGRCPAGGVDRPPVGWEAAVVGGGLKDDRGLVLFVLGVVAAGGNKTFIWKHSQAYTKVARLKIA